MYIIEFMADMVSGQMQHNVQVKNLGAAGIHEHNYLFFLPRHLHTFGFSCSFWHLFVIVGSSSITLSDSHSNRALYCKFQTWNRGSSKINRAL